jgi:hypothetical protein
LAELVSLSLVQHGAIKAPVRKRAFVSVIRAAPLRLVMVSVPNNDQFVKLFEVWSSFGLLWGRSGSGFAFNGPGLHFISAHSAGKPWR